MKTSNPQISAFDVANYFLTKAEKDEELLSNLKLQKLVYYAQGLHLALNDMPIFNERIRAWAYGPVIPDLYFDYKDYGAGGIPADKKFSPKSIDKKIRDFLDEVYQAFGQFSAQRLIQISHTDKCWEDAHPNGIITHKAMREHLKKYLTDVQEKASKKV
jgi:uncharacterized phage-associated protein